MRAINIVGFKGTGKTTLAMALAKELTERGLRVAVVKSTSHENIIDSEGTDSYKLRKACGTAALVAPDGAAVFYEGKRYIKDLLPVLGAEVLLVEGGKKLDWLPRIMLLHKQADADTLDKGLALCTAGKVAGYGMLHTEDIPTLANLVLEKGFSLAGLDCKACNRPDCQTLARDIVAQKATVKDCKSLYQDFQLKVGGEPLGLNPFVQRIFAATLSGMLKELKGYEPGMSVEISFKGE